MSTSTPPTKAGLSRILPAYCQARWPAFGNKWPGSSDCRAIDGGIQLGSDECGDPDPIGPVRSVRQRDQRPRVGVDTGTKPAGADALAPAAGVVQGAPRGRIEGVALNVKADRGPGAEAELFGDLAGLVAVAPAIAGGEVLNLLGLAADVGEQEPGDPVGHIPLTTLGVHDLAAVLRPGPPM